MVFLSNERRTVRKRTCSDSWLLVNVQLKEVPQVSPKVMGVDPQIVRSIQPVLESIQYAEAWHTVFSI